MTRACLALAIGLGGPVASAGIVGGAFGQAGAVAGGKTPEQAAAEKQPKPKPSENGENGGNRPSRPTRPSAEAIKALDTAVKSLAKEYQDFEKNPSASIRTESNYFKDNAADVPAEALWDMLGRRLDSDPAVDGYVKWQLLSAPSAASVEGKLVAKAAKAYRAAPLPLARPGRVGNNQLAKALQGKKEADVTQINTELTTAIQTKATQNEPILKYRDSLYDRLPPGPEKFELGLRDFVARQQAGANAADLATKLAADIQAWVPTAKKPQLSGVGQMLVRAAHETGPEFYTAADWKDDKRGGEWSKKRIGEDSAIPLADLVTELQQGKAANNAAAADNAKPGKKRGK
jgi:hypothetical protein